MEHTNKQDTTHANSTEQVVNKTKNISNFITPIAIVIAGILISTSLYFRGDTSIFKKDNSKDKVNNALTQSKIEIADISNVDHIRGSKDAKIVIIEYSDIECPFCKVFHSTLKRVFDEYNKDNQVAWVYRHFPISYGDRPLHKNAAKEAEATECAAEIGGNDVFWKYLEEIYNTTKSNDGLALSELPVIAEKVGLDKTKFQTCLDSGKYAAKVKESYEASLKAGAKGTPYTVIKYNGEFIPLINDKGDGLGALPYEIMKQVIDQLLNDKK